MAIRFEITKQIAYIGAASYPIAAISSLRVATKWRPILGLPLVVLAGILLSNAFDSQPFGTVAGLVVGLIAIVCLVPKYILVIGSAGGEKEVLSSYNRRAIEAMRREIEAAITARSRAVLTPSAGGSAT